MRIVRYIFLLLIAVGICYSQTAYVSPLKGTLSGQDYTAVVKDSNTYYVFNTGARIPCKSSTDRITWASAGTVFSTNPSWFNTSVPAHDGNIWAPDIAFRSGKYWLYYAISSFGSNTSAIGLATATRLNSGAPGYGWVDQGLVMKSVSASTYNCIDAATVVDNHGSWWMAFGSFWTGVKLVRLDSLTGKLSSTDTTVYSIASRPSVTSNPIEAPFIFHHGAYYYLFVSWDYCCKGSNSTYNIRFGRSNAITGPYLDKAGKDMQAGGGTLLDTSDSRWKGPGVGGVFIDHDSVFLAHHAYDANSGGSATLLIRPLFFSSDWPSFNASTAIQDRPCGLESPVQNLKSLKFTGTRLTIPAAFRGKAVSVTIFNLSGKLLLKTIIKASTVTMEKGPARSDEVLLARLELVSR